MIEAACDSCGRTWKIPEAEKAYRCMECGGRVGGGATTRAGVSPGPACRSCGKSNPEGTAFCEHCGTALADDRPPQADQVDRRMAIREFDLIIKNGMTKDAFEETRTFLRSYIKLYAQSPAQQLGWLMDSRYYGRKNYLKELDQLLAKVKLDEVIKSLRKHWQTQNIYVAIITDVSEAEQLAESLRGNLASPMSYSNVVKSGLSREILVEDEEVADYKLNIKLVEIVPSEDTLQ